MRRQRSDRYAQQAKRSLSDYINKQAETIMIGALAAIEQNFGHLWGYGKDDEVLSPKERDMKDRWQITRTRILDLGNSRMANIKEEFEYFIIQNAQFNYDFNLKKEDE